MTQAIAHRLTALRDIEGVLGSFVIGERGEVLGRDVTAACSSEALAMVGGRLSLLCDAFVNADIGGPFESTTLHYAQYKLHIRALDRSFVVAVVAADVNLPALKMAINMLAKQLAHELTHFTPEVERPSPPPERTSQPPQRPSQAPPAPERTSAVPPRSYRGTRIAH